MLLLTVIGPCALAAGKLWGWPAGVMRQFSHPWGGFTLWDIIMPMFIFMCGAAVPFALGRRLDPSGRPTAAFWRHIAFRVAMLWVLGMIVQGYLLTFDPLRITYYSNTLQTIAAGYAVAALVLLVKSRAVRFAMPFVLVAAYSLMLHFCGDYSRDGNFAMVVERKILAVVLPEGTKVDNNGYTWFLTTFMFGAMTLFGMQATEILRGAASAKKGLRLLCFGAALLAAGWALVAAGVPMIKHIYTASFTLQAMGWCMVSFSALYFVCDVLGMRRGTWMVVLFGQTALAAYLLHSCLSGSLDALSNRLLSGVVRICGGDSRGFVMAVGSSVALVFLLHVWRTYRSAMKGGK